MSQRKSLVQTFQSDLDLVVTQLRTGLRATVAEAPGSPQTAAELSRSLGVSTKLAWQVWRLAFDEGVPEGSAFPGMSALEGFGRAAVKAGVREETITPVEDAVRALEGLRVLHAGDQASLQSMLRWAWRTPESGIQEGVRRQAFLANSEIWGVQSRVVFQTVLLAPGADPERVDDVCLTGEVGLRRLRSDAVCTITGVGQAPGSGRGESLSTGASGFEPVIPEFSTHPLPFQRARVDDQGRACADIAPGPVGRSGEMTFVLGQAFRNAGWRKSSEERRHAQFVMHTQRPYGLYICDLLVRRDLWQDVRAEVMVYSAAAGYTWQQSKRREADQLPIAACVDHLGDGLGAATCPEIPRYEELLKWTCDRMGWNPARFSVHRLRLAYPPMPTSVVVRTALP